MEKIIVTAVGDICLGDSPKCLGFGLKSKLMNSDGEFLFENIKSSLSGDIIFGNLECVLSEKGLKRNDFYSEQLRGHPEFIKILKSAGFNVLNVANNHMLQHGVDSYDHTVELLKGNEINVVGERGGETFSRPVVLERSGGTVGFLGYSFEKERCVSADNVKYANTSSGYEILSDIKRLRPCVDWLILSLHWGMEFMDYPSPVAVDMAKIFVDAGVDVILGHHPHVIQPIVRYNNSVVCFSLGNLIFDMQWNKSCAISMVVRIELSRVSPLPKFEVVPLIISDDYRPVIATGSVKRDIFAKMDHAANKINEFNYVDIERSSFMYYRQCLKQRRQDMWLSNIFFLKTLFTITPKKFLLGKILYFISKFFVK